MNGRNARSKRDNGRDAGPFVALPFSVMDCPSFAKLSYAARSLLLEVARQLRGDDNGRALLSRAYLSKRGWTSNDVIQRAKVELIEGEFIFETVKGCRPNRASWYAVTWHKLGRLDGFDPWASKAFIRSAYRRDVPLIDATRWMGESTAYGKPLPPLKPKITAPANGTETTAIGGTVLTPADGIEGTLVAPADGAASASAVPADGPMRAVFDPPPVPPSGHPLEMPSPVVGIGAGVGADQKQLAQAKATAKARAKARAGRPLESEVKAALARGLATR